MWIVVSLVSSSYARYNVYIPAPYRLYHANIVALDCRGERRCYTIVHLSKLTEHNLQITLHDNNYMVHVTTLHY